jgi:two-component system chemotaxis response regulator CheB
VEKRDIIVIGTSAGGVDALRILCRGLPSDLPAALFVVQHLAASTRSVLPELLTRAGVLPAASPREGERIRQGHIYVAPPDRHMLLEGDQILLRRGPIENRCRPAIDPLFRSAAVAYGPRVIGVVMTGLLDDGSDGLAVIKRAGGTTIVQDPDDAEWPSMPRNALAHAEIDHCVPLAELAALLVRLVREPAGPSGLLPASIVEEVQIAQQEIAVMESSLKSPGHPSAITCPDCGGVLNEISEAGKLRYRCQVGHAFSPASLVDAQNHEIERALAIAVRTHRDRLNLFRRMELLSEYRQQPNAARRWHAAAAESERLASMLEQAMGSLRKPSEAAAE